MTTTARMYKTTYWLVAASIGLITFFSGLYVGQSSTSPTAIDPSQGYMLLLHEPESFQPGEPMEMFQEYGAWIEKTQDKGVTVTGQELALQTVYVNQSRTAAGSEGKSYPTTGYFVLEASSIEEAVEIARNNPHLKYGGEIEVKPFQVR